MGVLVYFFAPWFGDLKTRALLAIGFAWVVLTVRFEFSMGILLFHFPLSRILEDFNVVKGGLFPLSWSFSFSHRSSLLACTTCSA